MARLGVVGDPVGRGDHRRERELLRQEASDQILQEGAQQRQVHHVHGADGAQVEADQRLLGKGVRQAGEERPDGHQRLELQPHTPAHQQLVQRHWDAHQPVVGVQHHLWPPAESHPHPPGGSRQSSARLEGVVWSSEDAE
eukprot:6320005-Pyramimonas_sp.AAC.1